MASSRKPSPAEVRTVALQALRRRVTPGARLCVGLSGGLDSTVLLHLLKEQAAHFPFELSAVHVNHRVHPEALRWQEFCERLCLAMNVPLRVETIEVDRRDPEGLEAAARRLRYAAYTRQPADFIVLAHHQDDQAETLLTQLLRGAGVPGLAAMPELRPLAKRGLTTFFETLGSDHFPGKKWSDPFPGPFAGPAVFRPLLAVPRASLVALAEADGLEWVDDPSNEDTTLVRNYLRHRVGPVLSEQFPSWKANIARSAAHLAEAAALLDVLARADYEQCGDEKGIRTSDALALGEARAANLLRAWLEWQGAPACSAAQLREWLCQASAGHDRNPRLRWGGWELTRFDGRWQLHPAVASDWAPQQLDSWPPQPVTLPGAGILRATPVIGTGVRENALMGPMTVRRREGGERLRPRAGGPSRSLRNLLQEAGVPPWQRAAMPLVFCQGKLACVPGVAVDAEFLAGPGEAGLELAWVPTAV
jgi:tRNA(Ile)-lysidine synthase